MEFRKYLANSRNLSVQYSILHSLAAQFSPFYYILTQWQLLDTFHVNYQGMIMLAHLGIVVWMHFALQLPLVIPTEKLISWRRICSLGVQLQIQFCIGQQPLDWIYFLYLCSVVLITSLTNTTWLQVVEPWNFSIPMAFFSKAPSSFM